MPSPTDSVKILFHFSSLGNHAVDTTIKRASFQMKADTEAFLCQEMSFVYSRFNGSIKCTCRRTDAVIAVKRLTHHIMSSCAFTPSCHVLQVPSESPVSSEYGIVVLVSSIAEDVRNVLGIDGADIRANSVADADAVDGYMADVLDACVADSSSNE